MAEVVLIIVVGDPHSINNNGLAQVSEEIVVTKAYCVTDVSEIYSEWLKDIKLIVVTSGAATPANHKISYLFFRPILVISFAFAI